MTIAPHDVDGLPDLYFANAHEHLGVHGLGQGVIELPLHDVLGQPHHVRLDKAANHAAHQDLDT